MTTPGKTGPFQALARLAFVSLVMLTELAPEIIKCVLCAQERMHSHKDINYWFSNSNVRRDLRGEFAKIQIPRRTELGALGVALRNLQLIILVFPLHPRRLIQATQSPLFKKLCCK